jgi:glutamyl-tRNA synthetase
MTVVTRFAPSPTGYLHVGGVRTALFSWLYARHHGGRFILRIEDTDQERSTEESVQAILEGMHWLGLDYDEGPYYQTRRMDRYREVIREMLDAGLAYRCYCTKEELEAMRTEQRAQGLKPRYDGRCRARQEPRPDVEPVVRFRNPDAGEVIIDDLVKGKIVIGNRELDDLVIARSDGYPTYNFTVVVDDMDMGITHVIRGDDHVNNTPRQINILRALGATLPAYGHVPMILGADGQRLSKRHGAVSVTQYRDEGYLPDALLNYLVRLGWSRGDQEIFTRAELIEHFDIRDVNGSAAVFNPEKLLWLNYEYMKASPLDTLVNHARPFFAKEGIDLHAHANAVVVIQLNQERSKTLVELVERSRFFFEPLAGYDPAAVRKHWKADTPAILGELRDRLESLDPWTAVTIHAVLQDIATGRGVGLGQIAQPLRIALSGGTVSPPIDATLEVLGRDETLARLAAASVALAGA